MFGVAIREPIARNSLAQFADSLMMSTAVVVAAVCNHCDGKDTKRRCTTYSISVFTVSARHTPEVTSQFAHNSGSTHPEHNTQCPRASQLVTKMGVEDCCWR